MPEGGHNGGDVVEVPIAVQHDRVVLECVCRDECVDRTDGPEQTATMDLLPHEREVLDFLT